MPTRRIVTAIVAAALFVVAVAGDTLALAGIRAYRHALAPVVSRMGLECRFTPSCSYYGEIAIARDGLLRGGWRTLGRVSRCHPWTPKGTIDEP
jgi:putative membrane protein insertion efficiency factor